MVMHAQVPEFKTKSPVDNYVFQNHCQRGGNVLYLTGEALLCKQYVYVSFKGVSASFFWQRGWDVFSNSKEFVIYSMFLTFWLSDIFLKWNAKNVPESNKCLSFGGPSLCSWWCVPCPLRCALRTSHTLAQMTLAIPSLVTLATHTSLWELMLHSAISPNEC